MSPLFCTVCSSRDNVVFRTWPIRLKQQCLVNLKLPPSDRQSLPKNKVHWMASYPKRRKRLGAYLEAQEDKLADLGRPDFLDSPSSNKHYFSNPNQVGCLDRHLSKPNSSRIYLVRNQLSNSKQPEPAFYLDRPLSQHKQKPVFSARLHFSSKINLFLVSSRHPSCSKWDASVSSSSNQCSSIRSLQLLRWFQLSNSNTSKSWLT